MSSLGEGFVSVKPDVSSFDDELRRGLDDAFDKLLTRVQSLGEDIEDAFKEAATQSDDQLTKIGGADVWSDLKNEADRAGEAVTSHMKEAARQSDTALKGINIGGLATRIGGTLAAVGIGRFFTSAAGEAEQANKALAVTEQVIRATGAAAGLTAQDVADLASQLSLKVAIDDDDIMEASNVLLTFKNVKSDVFGETMEQAANLGAVLGTDLSAASTMLGKALNDPIAGLTALGRAGVQFTKDQKAQIKSMVDAGDTAGAQKIILAELESQLGGTAAAAATTGDKMKVSFGEAKEALGVGLLGAFESMGPALNDLIVALTPVLEMLGGAVGEAIQSLLPTIGSLVEAFTPIVDVFVGLLPIITPIIELLAGAFADAITIVAAAITPLLPPLAELVQVLITALQPILPILSDLLGQVAKVVVDVLLKALDTFLPVIEELAPLFADIFAELATGLLPVLPDLADLILAVLDAVKPLIPPLVDLLKFIIPPLTGVLSLLADLLRGGLRLAIDGVTSAVNLVRAAVETVAGWFQTLWEKSDTLRGFLGDLISLALTPVTTAIDIVWGAVETAVGWFEDLWNATEPVRELFAGAFNTALDGIKTVIGDIGTAVSSVVGFFGDLWEKTEGVRSFFAGAFSTGIGVAKAALDGIRAVVEKIVGWIAGIIEKAKIAVEWLKKVNPFAADVKGKVGTGIGDVMGKDNAWGDVYTGRTNINVGEDGKEVVVPLTKPARAMQLADESGLTDLVRRERGGQQTTNPYPDPKAWARVAAREFARVLKDEGRAA